MLSEKSTRPLPIRVATPHPFASNSPPFQDAEAELGKSESDESSEVLQTEYEILEKNDSQYFTKIFLRLIKVASF